MTEEQSAALLEALEKMVEVFGPGVDCFGDGAGYGEIEAVKQARAAIVGAKEPAA